MKRVLVIDSEPTNRKQVQQRLEADGHAVSETESAERAVEAFQSGASAVILSQDAAELSADFFQRLRTLEPAPVVIVSSPITTAFDANSLQALRDGGVYVTRPASEPPSDEYRLPVQGINFYDLERSVLSQALKLCRGNQTRAGTLLGLSRDQIRYRMAKFGLTSSGFQVQNESPKSNTRPRAA